MKKLVCLLFLIIFLTGCDADYNITINKNTISEQLQIYENDSTKWDIDVDLFSTSYREVIEDNLKYKLGIFIDEQLADAEDDNPNYIFYKPQKVQTKDKLGIVYKYIFTNDNYERAYFPNNCFDNFKVYVEKGYIMLSTSKGFKCIEEEFGLSNLTINIVTKYQVETSNSDIIEGRTHKWVINKYNADSKNVYISINTNEISKEVIKNQKEDEVVKIFLTIGISIAILIIIVIIFLINKKRKLENY